jgi:hypothetical protein
MTDDSVRRADDGSVLRMAFAAVMLVLAGLGVMAWDESQAASPASIQQQ